MAMLPMTTMEMDDEDKLDAAMPVAMPDKPDYPWGLCLTLTSAELDKLGLDPEDAKVGGTFMMQAIARITSVSCVSTDNGDCWRVETQIEDMGVLGSDEAEDGAA